MSGSENDLKLCREASDGDLVGLALRGSEEAFGELVRRYRRLTFATALHYLGRVDDAQDAAQEALVQAYLHLKDLRRPERFGAWLHRTTVNHCLAALRRAEAPLGEDRLVEPEIRDLADQAAVRIAVRRALERLPEKLRLTVTLCYIHGRSHDEVARFLDLPVATVRSRLQHAKRQLRKEMADMVEQSIKKTKPARGWSRKVVQEVLRRADEARHSFARAEAARLYDDALTALEKGRPSRERSALAVQALLEKQSLFAGQPVEKAQILEKALVLARKIGDREAEARALFGLAGARRDGSAYSYYREAFAVYRDLGDAEGQGNCLLFLGGALIMNGEIVEGRKAVEEARPLLAQAGSYELWTVCESTLALLDQAGGHPLANFSLWSALCTKLEDADGAIRLAGQPGFVLTRSGEDIPYPNVIGNVFFHASLVRPFLRWPVAAGESWRGAVWSFSDEPLMGTLAVIADTQTVATPAGRFENCLTVETTIAAGDGQDLGTDVQREMDRRFTRGRRRFWYAPEVGLVKVRVETDTGENVASDLVEYHISGLGKNPYLPLARGNAWTYRVSDLPAGFESHECCCVVEINKDRWFLAHHAYVLRSFGQKDHGLKPVAD